MGIISKHKRKVSLYYHRDSTLGKKALAYFKSTGLELLSIDLSATPVTETQWAEIINLLKVHPRDLLDTTHPKFKTLQIDQSNLSETDWLKVLRENTELIRCPFAIVGKDCYLIQSPQDVYRFISPDSAGIPKDFPDSRIPQ